MTGETRLSASTSARISNVGLFCSFLVVGIHVPNAARPGTLSWWCISFFQNGLCRIAVPYFFIVSGYFLARHAFQENWWILENRKRLRTLLVPYFFWGISFAFFSLALTVVANVMAGAELTRNFLPFETWICDVLGLVPYDFPLLIPFWYVRNLILLCWLSPIIIGCVRKSRLLGAAWLAFAACLYAMVPCSSYYCLIRNTCLADCFRKFFSFEGLFYFSAGVYLCFWPIRVNIRKGGIPLMFILGCLAFSATCLGEFKGGAWYPYFRLVAIPIALTALFKWVPDATWARWLVTSSFPIYCIHVFSIQMLVSAANVISPGTSLNFPLFHYAFVWAFSITLSIALTVFLRRAFPKFSRFVFGGR